MSLVPPEERQKRTPEQRLFHLKVRIEEILRMIEENPGSVYSHGMKVVLTDLLKEFKD